MRSAGGLSLLLLAAAPAQAGDCAGLTRHFQFCDAGSAWAAAEWEQFGDGAALHLDGLSFDFTEDWAGRRAAGPQPREVALAALVAPDPDFNRVLHGVDGFATGSLEVARAFETFALPDEGPVLRAVMIAEGGGAQVMLMLTGPKGMDLAEMDRRSREVAGLVQPRQAEDDNG